jgi:hypothetical protein
MIGQVGSGTPTVFRDSRSEARLATWKATVFVLGLAFTWLCWTRSQVAGDQLNMLARGWLLVAEADHVSLPNPDEHQQKTHSTKPVTLVEPRQRIKYKDAKRGCEDAMPRSQQLESSAGLEPQLPAQDEHFPQRPE